MSDIRVPAGFKEGDAVLLHNSAEVGIIIKIVSISDIAESVALVYWPKGVEYCNVATLYHAFL